MEPAALPPIYIQYDLIQRSLDMIDGVVTWARLRVDELLVPISQVMVGYCKDPQTSQYHASQEVAWVQYLDFDMKDVDRDFIDWESGHLICKPCLGTGRIRRPGADRPSWLLCPECSGRGRSMRRITGAWRRNG